MKLFTLDNRLIIQIFGRLSDGDRRRAAEHIRRSVAPDPTAGGGVTA